MQSTAETRNLGGWYPIPHRRGVLRPVPRTRPALQLLAAWTAMRDGRCVFGAVGSHDGKRTDCSIGRSFAVLVARVA